ncbi:alpha/beta hydrolase [Candidatus Woesearchaeota archaeon]|nr:alpha/beta hydrolase [Candidatus Woesearchaeota archaeon]
MKEFEPYWQHVNEDTVFVGRSIGPAFILRLLEKPKIKVKAAFLVAGFCSDLGVHQYRPLINTFIDNRFRWEKIRNSCKKFFVYHSDNDPVVQLEKGRELSKKLRTKLRTAFLV